MSDRRIVWLAWALFSLTLLSSVGSTAATMPYHGESSPLRLAGDLLLVLGAPSLFAGVAALIVARQPRNTIGWLLMTPALMITVVGPIDAYLLRVAPAAAPPPPLLLVLAWVSSWSWVLLIFPLLLVALLFPSGRPPSPRWRWAVAAAVIWGAAFVLAASLAPTIEANTTPAVILHNPIGVFDQSIFNQLFFPPWFSGLLGLVALSAAAPIVRFRRAGAVEREQIKWLLFACAIFAAVYLVGGAVGLGDIATPAGEVWNLCFSLAVIAIPAAIGVAILRHRLFDINVIIRRTLVYATLTISLGALYLLGVVALQALFVRLTGQASTLAVVASTLAIAALSGPLRARVQGLIDRRFFRRKYDAQQVLTQFARRAQQQADLDALSGDVLTTVRETLEPEGARLWLVRR